MFTAAGIILQTVFIKLPNSPATGSCLWLIHSALLDKWMNERFVVAEFGPRLIVKELCWMNGRIRLLHESGKLILRQTIYGIIQRKRKELIG